MSRHSARGIDLAAVFRKYGHELHQRGGRWWTLCPVHQEKTPSCEVDLGKGLWHCFGCGEGGDAITLVEKCARVPFKEALAILGIDEQQASIARPSGSFPARDRQPARSPFAFAGPSARVPDACGDSEEDQAAIAAARRLYGECAPLLDTPAAWYCEARGVLSILAAASGARYAGNFMGNGPALVFPVFDQEQRVTAIQGRYLGPTPAGVTRPADKMTRGRLRGVFCTMAALQQEAVIVTEAPFDSLSLSTCGFPSIALLGVNFPDWLPGAIGARRVYLATDNDAAGDGAAQKLCDALAVNGGKIYRLKPEGAKDWNEYLCTFGPRVMETAIVAAAFPGRHPTYSQGMLDDWIAQRAQAIARREN